MNGLTKSTVLKRVQLWFRQRLPTGIENLCVDTADVILVSYPGTLQGWIRRQQASGIKVLPYVSFYKAPELAKIQETRDWEAGSPSRSECLCNPFWQAVAADDHPEWYARDEGGNIRRPFNNDGYAVGWNQTSPPVKSYRDACLQGIAALMESGVDGIYLDNVCIEGNPAHYGSGSGTEVDRAVRALITEAAGIVHRHHPGAMFCANMARPAPHDDMRSVIDAYIMESMMFSWAWDMSTMLAEWPDRWAHYRSQAWSPGNGPQPIVLPYLGFSGRSLREDAYTVMAAAWILGLAFSDAGTAADPSWMVDFAKRNLFQGGRPSALLYQAKSDPGAWLEDFYRLDIGNPVDDSREIQGCLLRRFDGGACLFNPTPESKQITVEGWSGATAYEHACGVAVDVRSGRVPVWLPPLTGRVLTSR